MHRYTHTYIYICIYDRLPADDRAVLASEMCRTGFADQVIYKYRDTCIYV